MPSKVGTKATASQNKYDQLVMERYKMNLPYTQVIIFYSCIIFSIVNFIKMQNYIVSTVWIALALLLPLFLATALKFRPDASRQHSKFKAFCFALMEKAAAVTIGGLLSYINIMNLLDKNRNIFLTYFTGFEFLWAFYVLNNVFSRWHTQSVCLCTVIIPIFIVHWRTEQSAINEVEITLRVVMIIINFSLLSWLQQRGLMYLFNSRIQLEEKEQAFTMILDQLPENILILSSEVELKYYNKCFQREIVGPDEQIETRSIKRFLSRFKNLEENESPGDTTDRKRAPLIHIESLLDYLNGNKEGVSSTGLKLSYDASLKVNFEVGDDTSRPMRRGSQSAVPSKIQKNFKINLETVIYRTFQAELEYERMSESPGRVANIVKESVEIRISPIVYSGEESVLIIVRKTPEHDLVKELDQLNHYKDEILASVSHELRTPINSNINLLSESLKSPDIPKHMKDSFLEPAYKSAKILLCFVNDILDISQIREKKLRLVPQTCNLYDLLHDCYFLFEQQCRQKGINFHVHVEKSVPKRIRTDPNRLTQIILNLISNAYKFTFEGRIMLSAKTARDGLVEIAVEDTGLGIKKEDQSKLMRRFEKIDLGERMSSNSTGAGLGLSIANSLSKMLGPFPSRSSGLKVQSEFQKGSRFSFLVKSRENFTNVLKNYASVNSPPPLFDGDCTIMTDIDSASMMFEEEMSPKIMPSFHNQYLEDEDASTAGVPTIIMPSKSRIGRSLTKIDCECSPILVVDDDCFNVMTINTMLQSMNVTPDSVFSGVKCLEKFESLTRCSSTCQKFKIVIMDSNMPIKSGVQTTKELIEWGIGHRDIDFAVIGCSADSSEKKRNEFLKAGAQRVIDKPLKKEELRSILLDYGIICEAI